MTIARRHMGAGFDQRDVAVSVQNVSGIRGWTLAEMDWPELPGAVCAGDPDPEAWFPGQGRPGARQAAVIAKCNRCPVKRECLQYALDYDQKNMGVDTLSGIWGGKTEAERKELVERPKFKRCRNNKHELTPDNIYNGSCYQCRLETNREYKRAKREAS